MDGDQQTIDLDMARALQFYRTNLPWMTLVVFQLLSQFLHAQPQIPASAPPGTLYHDFDHDGQKDQLTSNSLTNEIRTWVASSASWEKADYGLPPGVHLLDQNGQESGLRFVDLNGDGFDDILFSNPEAYAIYLWNKTVRPELGWLKGWSQPIRRGKRTGNGIHKEPPSLVGSEVRVTKDELVISFPSGAKDKNGASFRWSLKELIAFDMPPPLSPEEGLASLHVPSGFRVELVAAEPVVIDPISFDWGADGRLWVVEMRDYPLGIDGQGKAGGVIKVIEDTNGDGRCDKTTSFLEGIPFPSSVLPWKKGALIAAAPDLIYAEDTDGDGKADVRKTLFTGFNPGNQQHRFNGFEWGLDGWIYAANGDSGGSVRSIITGKTISISGRDIRFRPDTGELETVSGQTQFARRRDDWGNWFGNNNPTWLWHVTLPEHYLRRNPRLAVKRVLHVLANYPDSSRVFPISAPLIRPNQPEFLNHTTSGCSPTPYRDDLFGLEFANSVFASEPVHNVVHREVLSRAGSGFTSHRAAGEQRGEFLASSDNWFRPITTRTGPDGALYVADMYRFVLEHPEWIAPEMQARLDLRAGDDKGRIYRIVPVGKNRRTIPDLSHHTPKELVAALNSPNGWQRDMAQRLLLERPNPSTAPDLQALLEPTHAPQVRLQALATLGLLGALSAETVVTTLNDPHPWVRCEALRQSERFAPASGVFQAVAAVAEDSDAAVRLQAAFSLGTWPRDLAEPALLRLVSREDADELLRIAVMSSLVPQSPLFQQLDSKATLKQAVPVVRLTPSSADRAQVIAAFTTQMQPLSGDPARGQKHFQSLCMPCHKLRGEGSEVGPDLGMVSGKPDDWLLTAILDPSQAVESRYKAWSITLKSGEVLDGVLSAETANNLVLRRAGGIEHAVLRDDLSTMSASKLSLMPTGFESALKPQDMADLIRWLRAP